jgi:hypothetical protein
MRPRYDVGISVEYLQRLDGLIIQSQRQLRQLLVEVVEYHHSAVADA